MRSSKFSVAFARQHNIERFKGAQQVDPSEFTEEEFVAFQQFKKDHDTARAHSHYINRKESGNLSQKKSRSQMTSEELNHARDVGRRDALKRNLKRKNPDVSNDQLEAMVDEKLKTLGERQGTEAMKTGPPRGSTMAPRTKKAKQGSQNDDSVDSSQPRPKGKHANVNYLQLFLGENPEIPKVTRPCEFPPDTLRQYQRFRTNYNGRARYYENQEAEQEQRRNERRADPDRFRETEARYRERVKAKESTEEYKYKYASNEEWMNSLQYRWSNVQSSASQKNMEVELTLSDVDNLSLKPCHYCGRDPQEIHTRFGIDRVDNTQGYTLANSVTCCTMCNYAKKNYHVKDFLRGMCNVAHTLVGEDEENGYVVSYDFLQFKKKPGDFSLYRYSAQSRGLEFNITLGMFDKMVHNPCYYCGRHDHRMGLDRVDSLCGYNEDSCVPCCSLCNSLKGANDVNLFFIQAEMIFKLWSKKLGTM